MIIPFPPQPHNGITIELIMTKIPRIPVQSSQVVTIGYDATSKEMDVEFKPFKPKAGEPNPVYRYQNVTPQIYAAIITGESIGREINQRIKKFPDRHPYKKLTKEELS